MTHKDPFDPKNSTAFPPGARGLELEQAIRAVTINPAWQIRMEDKIGSIKVGKYADLLVLEKNLFEVKDVNTIRDVKVLATMMDGKFRHREGL